MKILGIETSCDETGVAVYSGTEGLLGHKVYSQIALHRPHGGVVPELASRDHIHRTLPLIDELLNELDIPRHALQGIAYTRGPGLVGALLVGATVARSLAYGLAIPCVGVHHMEGHLLAPMLERHAPAYPFVALLVSGGHTLLVKVTAFDDYQLLGESLDDACGEAFDKTAKLLGLPYPGGAALSALAQQGRPGRYHFTRPMIDRPDLNFSFSGLKTAAMLAIRAQPLDDQARADLAHAFQEAVIETLVVKCQRALRQTGLTTLVVAGGVSANTVLQKRLRDTLSYLSVQVFYPRHEFCGDNGAMIAYLGWLRLSQGHSDSLKIDVKARWPLADSTYRASP